VQTVTALRADTPAFHAELNQLARVVDREQSQQHLVDQREDGRVRRDAQPSGTTRPSP
jgi:hypothetical protein